MWPQNIFSQFGTHARKVAHQWSSCWQPSLKTLQKK